MMPLLDATLDRLVGARAAALGHVPVWRMDRLAVEPTVRRLGCVGELRRPSIPGSAPAGVYSGVPTRSARQDGTEQTLR